MAQDPTQYPDLDRMVQQRRLGYIDQQALLRALNQQRMLAGQEPARSFEEVAAAPGPRPVTQSEVPPLQLDPRLFAGRGSSVQSFQPEQDTSVGNALAGLGQSDFTGMRNMFDQSIVPLPRPRPPEAPQAAPQGPQEAPGVSEQPAQPRTRLPLFQQPAPVTPDAVPRGANYMGGQPGQNIVPIQTAAGTINVHKDAAPALQGFINDLAAAGAPITGVGSYNYRKIAGSARWSQHAYGNAIDVNQTARDVVTPAFREWAAQNPGALQAAQVRWNIRSGGDWRSPDFGHFEWAGPPTAQGE